MTGYQRFMVAATAAFNAAVIGGVLVLVVWRGDAFSAAVLGVTLGVWVATCLLRLRQADVAITAPLVWLGDQPWTGQPGNWLLRTFTPREVEPYDPRHGE